MFKQKHESARENNLKENKEDIREWRKWRCGSYKEKREDEGESMKNFYQPCTTKPALLDTYFDPLNTKEHSRANSDICTSSSYHDVDSLVVNMSKPLVSDDLPINEVETPQDVKAL